MIFSIIKQIILSIILIVIIHYIYVFLKENLTQPKIKDLVNKPKMKYKEIYKSVEQSKINESNTDKMKNELQDYIKEISKKKSTSQTNIAAASNDNFFNNNYESL